MMSGAGKDASDAVAYVCLPLNGNISGNTACKGSASLPVWRVSERSLRTSGQHVQLQLRLNQRRAYGALGDEERR